MLTVTQLARECNLSRTTILYYEREQLLLPAYRADNGYRWYGDKEVERLRNINAYRSYGLSISSIKALLDQKNRSQAEILKEHFNELEQEIQNLRQQQKAIVMLLQDAKLFSESDTFVSKERWVEIMVAAGFSDADMTKWHQTFETMEPQEHQKFLESLGIEADEIQKIRGY